MHTKDFKLILNFKSNVQNLSSKKKLKHLKILVYMGTNIIFFSKLTIKLMRHSCP